MTICSASTATPSPTRRPEYLECEAVSDSRIGGISAISVERGPVTGAMAWFANLLHGRTMAVLGGPFSILAMNALRDVMKQNHRRSPWVRGREDADSLLSLQINRAGYHTKISPSARARRFLSRTNTGTRRVALQSVLGSGKFIRRSHGYRI